LKKIVFVTGGCRSGKSRFAIEFADSHFEEKIFVATCKAQDQEMRKRIKEHQRTRGSEWETVEVPTALAEAVATHASKCDVILIDCLTLWTNNLLAEGGSQEEILTHTDALIQAIDEARCSVILVSNEVGCGIVPENELARRFRDIEGLVNQKVAACADTVVWMVAGIPVPIKGSIGNEWRENE
jgi:adenosylcobinamide kinase/adenosylcobinamide-phosphate guanylyltransferase